MHNRECDPINGRSVLFDNSTKLFLRGTAVGIVVAGRHVCLTPVGGTAPRVEWSQVGLVGPIASRWIEREPVVSKQERTKRRVSIAKEQERQSRATAKRRNRQQRRRQLIVGAIVGFLALALVAPLTAGLLLDDSSVRADIATLPTTTEPPTLVDPDFAGASISGPTPCPATDGSERRTTSFQQAPDFCIDPAISYSMALDTSEGELVIDLDAAGAPAASNLAITFARYGVYDSANAISFISGLTIIGSLGSAGFTELVDPAEAPADGTYPIGSVIMFTKIGGEMEGQLAIVSTQEAADRLAEDPSHPIIGTVANLDAAVALDTAAAAAATRIGDVTVTETTS